MTSKVSVDFDMLDDAPFVLGAHRSNESDGLPIFGDVGDISFSRENSMSKSIRLDRETSRAYSRSHSFKDDLDIGPLIHENSASFIDHVDRVVLGRDNSTDLMFSRENSGLLGFLARETSADLANILCGTSSDISDVVFEERAGASSTCTPRAAAHSPTLHRSDELLSTAHTFDHSSTAASTAAEREAAAKRPRGAPGKSLRGAHVRHRPDMQRTARDGASHWAARVRAVRAEWAHRAAQRPAFAARFAAQAAAAHGRVKAKQECLLRFLQLAADAGTVLPPAEFGPGGFFGWRRFVVAAGRGGEFRSGLEGLFPAGFKEDTLKETFRRAGLLPERFQWEEGWRGGAAFEYRERA
jgi:hypothetical protein